MGRKGKEGKENSSHYGPLGCEDDYLLFCHTSPWTEDDCGSGRDCLITVFLGLGKVDLYILLSCIIHTGNNKDIHATDLHTYPPAVGTDARGDPHMKPQQMCHGISRDLRSMQEVPIGK